MTTRSFSLTAILLIGVVGGLVLASRSSVMPESNAAPATQAPAISTRPGVSANAPLPDLSTVAEAALKVAANISATTMVEMRSPFPFWFDEPQVQESQSAGSGVVVSSDGYVLTNTHVLQDIRANVHVTLADGRDRPGRIVGVDDLSDLAVIKIEATNLQTLPWGDSSKLRVAEWVLAIGNPYQLSGTVTLGIVSAVARAQSGGIADFIQTDAAINPGNSGGALVNARGELVGINSMIYSRTGGYQGIGFAIPSKLAQEIMGELIRNGVVNWGSIGYVELIDPAVARRYGFENAEGPIVGRMLRGSAADRGGLEPYDIVISFNGQRTPDSDQLNRLIVTAKPGTTARVVVQREGRRVTLDVPIVSRQQQQQQMPRQRRG